MTENNSLEKKLGVWGKDKIVREDGKTHAEDYYCVKCYSKNKKIQANSFLPIFDPDIPFFPYCDKHARELSIKLMLDISEDRKDYKRKRKEKVMTKKDLLEKKLGVWGKDEIVRQDNKFHAPDYYCVQCYNEKKEVPASGFWPDIENKSISPYCLSHLAIIKSNEILSTIDEHWVD